MNPQVPTFALIHSPLVGPYTWSAVADELRARGYSCIVPTLTDSEASTSPYWQQHVAAIVADLAAVPPTQPLCLAAHSGAGMLLPALTQQLPNPIVATFFVDAGIPLDGASRLDLLRRELPEVAEAIQPILEQGQPLPQWTAEDLRDEIPNAEQLEKMLAELHPRPLPFFTEPIPVPANWPAHPCLYIQFTTGYDYSAADAHSRGWPIHQLPGSHFHLLNNPMAVAELFLKQLKDTDSHG